MTRPASYGLVWGEDATADQMGGETATADQNVIEQGWVGSATAEPPTARMQNYWQTRVDLGLQEIERQGFLSWRTDVPYQLGAIVTYAGYLFQAISSNSGITPQGSSDNGIWSFIQPGKWPTTVDNISGVLPVANGGTSGSTPATARTGIGAAASGANSDIKSISGLTTMLPVNQGGTGGSTQATARSGIGAAASGTNSDIISLQVVAVPAPPQFSTTAQIMSAAALKTRGNEFRTVYGVTSSQLLNAGIVGGLAVISGSSITVTLPLASSIPAGGQITFSGLAAAATLNFIACSGSDTILGIVNGSAASTTAMNLAGGDTVTLVSDGGSAWHAASNCTANFINAQFWKGQSFATSGYQKFPGGLIKQWSQYAFTASGTQTLFAPLPISFPSAIMSASITTGSRLNNTAIGIDLSQSSKSSVAIASITSSGSGAVTAFYEAWGY